VGHVRLVPIVLGLAASILAPSVIAAPSVDEQLVGRWCSKKVIMHEGNGKVTSTKSSASQYMVQTFSKDRVVVEWARPPQSALWTQSYAIVAPGQIATKMLEHSSLPSLVGSKVNYRYEARGSMLKLISQPTESKEPVVESTWVRCDG
jgi:hypothetical protein